MGIEPDIDSEFILQLFEEQKGLCYWLKVPMVPSVHTRDPQRPSLDRLDCLRGYTRDNVVLCTAFANMGRRDASAERFAEFVELLTGPNNG